MCVLSSIKSSKGALELDDEDDRRVVSVLSVIVVVDQDDGVVSDVRHALKLGAEIDSPFIQVSIGIRKDALLLEDGDSRLFEIKVGILKGKRVHQLVIHDIRCRTDVHLVNISFSLVALKHDELVRTDCTR